MSTTINTPSRPLASLHVAHVSAPALLLMAQRIVTAMTGNPVFPTPTPTLTAVTAAIDGLTAAQTATLARTRGAVAIRDEQRLALMSLLDQLLSYVQSIADASPATAAAIIEGAGMGLRKKATRAPRAFSLRQGPVSGTAEIRTPSVGNRSSYEWQYSTDGGKTWVVAPPTLQARTTLAGLAPLTNLEAKFRAVTKTGPGDWSQAVAMTVL